MSGFGSPANTQGGFSLGNVPTLGTTALAANAQQAAGGFSFGAPKATTAAPAFGSSFLQSATPTATGLGTGTPATSSAPPALGANTNFSFGAQPVSTSSASSFNFGAPAQASVAANTTSTPSFNFGTPTASTAATATAVTTPAFGATATPAPAASSVPTLGGQSGGASFSFAKAPATTSASLNFGTTTTSATSFSGFSNTTGGGLFGKPATTGGLGLTTAAPVSSAASTPFVGLGGIDVTSSQPKPGDSKQDNIKVKETQVPEEISKTVDSLKVYIKHQKTLSSDIGRASTSKLSNVTGEILNLQLSLQEIANCVETNYNHIKLLRKETSKAIQSVEMAQRTQDTPAGLQFENSTPFQFFQSLVQKYESDLINFRQQIALTEKYMRSLTNPQAVSPEDLKRGFRQINESFISLAGRLHEIHQKVEVQKEQFLNLRKYRLRDATNVFAKLDNTEPKVNTSMITSGPTPFSNISGISSFGKPFSSSGVAAGASTNKTGK